MKMLALGLGLLWLAAGPAGAFSQDRYRDSNGKWYPVRWGPGTRTIRFQVNDTPLQLLPDLVTDTPALTAVQNAMQTWAFSPIGLEAQKTTSKASWGLDGVNLISFADTPQNRSVLNVNEARGATLRWWSRASGSGYWRLGEVDIILDPQSRFATDGRPGAYDLTGVLAHELGHALGLSHTPVASAVMWPYCSKGETRARVADPDDVNALYALYGDPDDAQTGTIEGTVTASAGGPVFGAHVVATDSDGVVRGSALTDTDGSFSLALLPPGGYTLFVEPINKEHTTGTFSYDYYHKAQRVFHSTFVGGSQPRSISVSPGQVVTLDPIRVEAQPDQMDIQYVGGSEDGSDFSNLNAHALTIPAGSYTNLLLVGEGLEDVTRIQASGPDVTFETNDISTEPWTQGYSGLYVPMSVRASAKPGGRNIYVYRSGGVAAYVGGIKVAAR